MEIIKTDMAPSAIGPYSQAVRSGGLIFCSGQVALKPNGQLIDGGVESSVDSQTKQVLENLKAILKASGSGLEKVVKTTIYLSDINDFVVVNEIYGSYFSGEFKPARATVQVAALPKGMRVEIDCIAVY